MSINTTLNQLKESQRKSRQDAKKLAQQEKELEDNANKKIPESVVLLIAQRVAKSLSPMAAMFMVSNLSKSGLKSRTGTLRKAVASCIVTVKLKGRPQLIVSFPPKLAEKIYAQANSLNYGAVRTGQGNGTSPVLARKTKNVLKAKFKDSATKTSQIGKVTVVKARVFFQLTSTQKAQLNKAFTDKMQAELQNYNNGNTK